MKKIMILMLVVLLVAGCSETIEPVDEIETNEYEDFVIPTEDELLRVASWNLQVFGPTKASDDDILDFYDLVLSQYDIIFVQEIRDKSGDAFKDLCKKFKGYECEISERDGRTTNKEQIGIIYKNNINLLSLKSLEDPNDVWERSPIVADFKVGEYEFTAYSTHIKPDNAVSEIKALEQVVIDEGNVMVLGDLNADCSYYDTDEVYTFIDWEWLIRDSDDTTVSENTDCAYDRIIVNNDMIEEIYYVRIFDFDITEKYSDHYIVSVEVIVGDWK